MDTIPLIQFQLAFPISIIHQPISIAVAKSLYGELYHFRVNYTYFGFDEWK